MIEHAKCGTQSLGRSYFRLKSTRMWSILWLSIILMGKIDYKILNGIEIKLSLALSIEQQKFGTQTLASATTL